MNALILNLLVILKSGSPVSEKRKWIVWSHTPPTRGQAVACNTNTSRLNNNTSWWPLSCNPTNSDLSLRIRCWETFNCPNCCGNPPSACLPYVYTVFWSTDETSDKIRQMSENKTMTNYQTDNIKNQEKQLSENVPLPPFSCSGEKHSKRVCQLQVSFAQARSKGHHKSVIDSSNGERGYI